MGYYTTYSLEWAPQNGYKPKPNCEHDLSRNSKFCPECGRPVGTQELDSLIGDYISRVGTGQSYSLNRYGTSLDATKWYEHDADMIEMSGEFRDVLFTLDGKGEEFGDIWRAWYLNGKMQKHKAEIVIAPLDPNAWTTPK